MSATPATPVWMLGAAALALPLIGGPSEAAAPASAAPTAPLQDGARPGRDIVVTAAPRRAGDAAPLHAVSVDAAPAGNDAAVGTGDLLKRLPGVTVTDGNGPRDVGLSIRGSNARIGSGVRNIVVLEDGFPVTQPNGIARLDLADPHAYRGIDVVRGPASARYGNFALEGAVDFQTRRGPDVAGIAGGLEGGSYDYANAYAVVGGVRGAADGAAFASFVHGGGATGHTQYDAGTFNALATIALGSRDRLTGKLIANAGTFALSPRLSFAQYQANPYQQGCERAAGAGAGCGTIAVFANGVGGARVAETAAEAGIVSNDRRLVAGLRFEHDLAAAATWRVQAVYDRRGVDQPSGALVSRGTLASYTLLSDLSLGGTLAGMASTATFGLAYADLDNRIRVFQRSPAGPGRLGAISQTVFGSVCNLRLFAREELQLSATLALDVAASVERSSLDGDQTAYAYPASGTPTSLPVLARRRFWNVAPAATLTWHPIGAITLHARGATGYGVPQLGQLFVTAAGVPGDNVALRTQRNRGVEVGAAIAVLPTLSAEATLFEEWFHDEQVTTSAGVNLLGFTTNAPRSRHHGVELGLHWRPRTLAGATLDASYGFDDQRYTDFTERVAGAGRALDLDRAGGRIPGVIPHFADVRLGYERAGGRFAGIGGFAELTLRSSYPIDNGGELSVPGYALLNLGVQYALPTRTRHRPVLFATVRNVTDRTYVGSALIVADTIDPATGRQADATLLRGATGSIFAGQPRTVVVGIRTAF